MKFATLTKAALISIPLVFSAAANAQLGLPSLPGKNLVGGGAATENPGDIVKNASNSLKSFIAAKIGLLEAMGLGEKVAAHKERMTALSKGDAASTSKDDLETMASIDKATGDLVQEGMSSNAKIDAKSKTLAGNSMVEYVKGLVLAKKTVSSVSSAAKNPMALGANAGSIVYLAKEMPGIVTTGSSTTSTLISYLSANGVDTSAAKKAAADLGT